MIFLTLPFLLLMKNVCIPCQSLKSFSIINTLESVKANISITDVYRNDQLNHLKLKKKRKLI